MSQTDIVIAGREITGRQPFSVFPPYSLKLGILFGMPVIGNIPHMHNPVAVRRLTPDILQSLGQIAVIRVPGIRRHVRIRDDLKLKPQIACQAVLPPYPDNPQMPTSKMPVKMMPVERIRRTPLLSFRINTPMIVPNTVPISRRGAT